MRRTERGAGIVRACRRAGTIAIVVAMMVAGTISSGAAGGAAAPAGTTTQGDQEDDRPVFEATVELAQLQVQVVDDDGRNVSGLTAEDFTLKVDGDERQIASVYSVDLDTDPVDRWEETPPPFGAWRQFLLFFDFTFTSPQGVLWARQAALEFLDESVRSSDLVAVATYSSNNGIRMLLPFTRDHALARGMVTTLGLPEIDRRLNPEGITRIVDPAGFRIDSLQDHVAALSDPSVQAPGTPGDVGGVDSSAPVGGGGGIVGDEVAGEMEAILGDMAVSARRLDDQRYASVAAGFVNQFLAFARGLTAVRGRKHLVMFSQGFADKILSGSSLDQLAADSQAATERGEIWKVQRQRGGEMNFRAKLDETLEILAASQTSVHAIDTSGLRLGSGDVGSRTDGRGTLLYFADATGGEVYWNTNELGDALAELEQATRTYYVLGYYPEEDDPPQAKVEIDVSVPGAEVQGAKRFTRSPDYEQLDPIQKQMRLAEFVAKQGDVQPIRFDFQAVPFAGKGSLCQMALLYEIPFQQLRELVRERDEGKIELEFFGYVMDERGEILDFFNRSMEMDGDAIEDALEDDPEKLFRYYDLAWAVPGSYRVRGIVREAKIGNISSSTVERTVPRFDGSSVAVAGPVFVPMGDPGVAIRGIDPSEPSERRAGGPVEYPFVVGEEQFVPAATTELSPGDTFRVFFIAYNLQADPGNGRPKAGASLMVTDSMGRTLQIPGLKLLAQSWNSEDAALSMVFEGQMPQASPGRHRLWVRVFDDLAGTTADANTGFVVAGGETAESE